MYTPASSDGGGPNPLLADPNYPPEAINVLTKADIQAAIELLKKATADPGPPPVYIVPSKEHAKALLDTFAGEKVDIPPVQENLFVIPPPAVPSGWTIEWRYRPDEIDWTTGQKYGETTWSHHGTWRATKSNGRGAIRCRMMMEKTLRRLRYSNRWRKQFRYRVTLWDYQGDIQWNGPPTA